MKALGQSDKPVEKCDYFDCPMRLPLRPLPGWAGLFISPGGGKHPDRSLPSHEIIFVRSGVLEIQEEKKSFTVEAGEALLLQAGRRHWGTAERQAGLELFWVHFEDGLQDPPEASGISSGEGQSVRVPQHTTVANPQFLETLFRHYLHEQEAKRLTPASAGLIISLMLCELARPALASDTRSAAAALAGRADIYLQTHFHEPLTPSQVAEELFCNSSYLSRIYRRSYGRTLTEALTAHRMEHARFLLLNTGQSVGEIARACGIADVSYFLKLFKRSTGTTALTFRRRHLLQTVNTR